MVIKVSYRGKLDVELDRKIQAALEGIGAKWYAQGFDLVIHERDICFDYESDCAADGRGSLRNVHTS